jgi:hypothetical protein
MVGQPVPTDAPCRVSDKTSVRAWIFAVDTLLLICVWSSNRWQILLDSWELITVQPSPVVIDWREGGGVTAKQAAEITIDKVKTIASTQLTGFREYFFISYLILGS